MRNRWRRTAATSLWCVAISVAVAITGCAAPQFTYVANSSTGTYFKVPYGWHQVDNTTLTQELAGLSRSLASQGSVWEAGYSPAGAPSATDAFNPAITQPFVLAFVLPLNKAASDAMSYNLLRNVLLPVTTPARQAAASNGFKLTGFRLLADSVITAGQGVHGVREIYTYTYPGAQTDTFDQVALTNADSTMVYVLVVHCLASCYQRHFKTINTVLSSFTVRSK